MHKRSDAVMGIEDAGDAVEAETVKLEFLHEVAEVGQEEAQDLVVAVIKQARVPELVAALAALVEVEVVAAVKHVDAVQHVLARVRVDDVKQYGDAQAVGGVDELLQFFGRAVAAGYGKERRHLVAKGSVVGVFLDGHELDDIVAELVDPRQDVCGKLLVGSDAVLGRADSHVGFVHASGLGFWRGLVLEDVFFGVPEDGVVHGADVEVLGDVLDPGGYAVEVFTGLCFHGDL